MHALATRIVCLLVSAVALAEAIASWPPPQYWAMLFGDHNNVTGACYVEEMDLRNSFPDLTHTMRATFFTHLQIVRTQRKEYYAKYRSCDSHGGREQKQPKRLRVGMFRLHVDPVSGLAAATADQHCTERHQGPTIVVARVDPPVHYGHQLNTIVPALTALKLHLAAHSIDATNLPVLLVDGFGPFSTSTAPNVKEIFASLGFRKWVQACPNCTDILSGSNENIGICIDKAIVLSFYYYGLSYHDRAFKTHYFWDRPQSLMDTDPVMMHIVQSVRARMGLPAALPLAPHDHQVIVVGSRSPTHRSSDPNVPSYAKQKRALLNEDELVAALAELPDVTVQQVSFGELSLKDTVTLMSNASLFIGYHGSAFHNVPFMARGGWVVEIMPLGSQQPPLFPSKAMVTGKHAVRYYNDDPARESCASGSSKDTQCLPHDMSLTVDVAAVTAYVSTVLKVQKWQLGHRFSRPVSDVFNA